MNENPTPHLIFGSAISWGFAGIVRLFERASHAVGSHEADIAFAFAVAASTVTICSGIYSMYRKRKGKSE